MKTKKIRKLKINKRFLISLIEEKEHKVSIIILIH